MKTDIHHKDFARIKTRLEIEAELNIKNCLLYKLLLLCDSRLIYFAFSVNSSSCTLYYQKIHWRIRKAR